MEINQFLDINQSILINSLHQNSIFSNWLTSDNSIITDLTSLRGVIDFVYYWSKRIKDKRYLIVLILVNSYLSLAIRLTVLKNNSINLPTPLNENFVEPVNRYYKFYLYHQPQYNLSNYLASFMIKYLAFPLLYFDAGNTLS